MGDRRICASGRMSLRTGAGGRRSAVPPPRDGSACSGTTEPGGDVRAVDHRPHPARQAASTPSRARSRRRSMPRLEPFAHDRPADGRHLRSGARPRCLAPPGGGRSIGKQCDHPAGDPQGSHPEDGRAGSVIQTISGRRELLGQRDAVVVDDDHLRAELPCLRHDALDQRLELGLCWHVERSLTGGGGLLAWPDPGRGGSPATRA